jgi:hypothetical protein
MYMPFLTELTRFQHAGLFFSGVTGEREEKMIQNIQIYRFSSSAICALVDW